MTPRMVERKYPRHAWANDDKGTYCQRCESDAGGYFGDLATADAIAGGACIVMYPRCECGGALVGGKCGEE